MSPGATASLSSSRPRDSALSLSTRTNFDVAWLGMPLAETSAGTVIVVPFAVPFVTVMAIDTVTPWPAASVPRFHVINSPGKQRLSPSPRQVPPPLSVCCGMKPLTPATGILACRTTPVAETPLLFVTVNAARSPSPGRARSGLSATFRVRACASDVTNANAISAAKLAAERKFVDMALPRGRVTIDYHKFEASSAPSKKCLDGCRLVSAASQRLPDRHLAHASGSPRQPRNRPERAQQQPGSRRERYRVD